MDLPSGLDLIDEGLVDAQGRAELIRRFRWARRQRVTAPEAVPVSVAAGSPGPVVTVSPRRCPYWRRPDSRRGVIVAIGSGPDQPTGGAATDGLAASSVGAASRSGRTTRAQAR